MKLREIYNYDNPNFAALRDAARTVTGAYGSANKWLDTVQEGVYIELGMKHTADVIHRLAHLALRWLDEFSGILHERHLRTEYPATEELTEEIRDVDRVFEVVIGILDEIQEALEVFHTAAGTMELMPMALKTEDLIMKCSAEYTKILEMWQMWDTGVSATSFENWVLHLNEGGVD